MKEIPLSRGKTAIIDDADYELIANSGIKWSVFESCGCFYASGYKSGNRVLMHRLILGIMKDSSQLVDHKNGNGFDNRRANLRLAKPIENSRNRKKSSHSQWPYKGIQFDPRPRARNNPWRAQIYINGKRKHLGHFSNPEDAACAYDQAATELFGEFANTNF